MEFVLVGLLIIPYMVFRLYKKNQVTRFERDKKRLAEGINLYYNKEYKKAYQYFDNQIIQTPKSATVYYFRAKCELKCKNTTSALYDLCVALSYDNTVPEFYIQKGKVHELRKEYEKALEEYNKAVRYSHGTHAEALRLRGVAYNRQGQVFQAYEDLQKALQLGDEHANYLLQSYPFSELRSRNNLF